MKNSPAIKSIFDKRVRGIVVQRNGNEESIQARKGVVLVSDEFGRSPEAKEYVGHDWTAQLRGNVGDGKRIDAKIGGALPEKNPHNAIYALISLLHVGDGTIRRFPHFAIDRSKPGSIIVGPTVNALPTNQSHTRNLFKQCMPKKLEWNFLLPTVIFSEHMAWVWLCHGPN